MKKSDALVREKFVVRITLELARLDGGRSKKKDVQSMVERRMSAPVMNASVPGADLVKVRVRAVDKD